MVHAWLITKRRRSIRTPANATEVFVVARDVANVEDRVQLPAVAEARVEGSNPSRLPKGTCSSVR